MAPSASVDYDAHRPDPLGTRTLVAAVQQIEGIALVRSGGLGKDWGYPGMDTTSIIGGPRDRTILSLVLWEDRYFCRS